MMRCTPAIINSLAYMLYASGALHLCKTVNRNLGRIPIITYHSIFEERPAKGERSCLDLIGMAVSKQTFIDQLRFIKRHYTIIDLDDLIEALNAPKRLPKDALVITFDDGLMDNYTLALPILNQLQCKAAFFIIGDAIRGKRLVWPHHLYWVIDKMTRRPFSITMNGRTLFQCDELKDKHKRRVIAIMKEKGARLSMSARQGLIKAICEQNSIRFKKVQNHPLFMQKQQLQQILDSGHLIGAHSMTHSELAAIDPEFLSQEVQVSRDIIESICPSKFVPFAYPYGTRKSFNGTVVKKLRQCGFSCALTTIEGLNNSGTQPYALRRIDIGQFNRITLSAHLSGAIGDLKSGIKTLLVRG